MSLLRQTASFAPATTGAAKGRQMRQPAYIWGIVMVATAGALWSLIGVVIKQLEDMDTWQVLFWRSAGMIPVLAGFILWRGGSLTRGLGPTAVAGALGLIAAFGGGILAIQSLPLANAVFLFSASPFLTALLGRLLLGERVRPLTWAAIAIAGLGIWRMIGGTAPGAGALTGHLAAIGSALGFAVFTVALRAGKGSEMLPTVILGALFSMAVSAAILGMQSAPLLAAPADIATALMMGAALLGLGMTLYTLGSRVVPAGELALLSQVEVMLAPVWGWLILAETPAPATLQGGALILGALLINALSGAHARRAQPA
jgi:drug/metabolite transporter (DMT)-like permease